VTPGASRNDSIRLLIAGLGNSLLADDGVGVHAVRELRRDPPPGASVVEVGTAVLDALHLFEAADTVLALDAVRAGEAPGTIYEVHPDAGAGAGPSTSLHGPGDPASAPSTSLHELDLRGVLGMLPADRRPDLIILGVEPERIDYGLELSPTVRAVLHEFVETVRRTARSLLAIPKADAPLFVPRVRAPAE